MRYLHRSCALCQCLKVCYQRSFRCFLESILALPGHTGQTTALYFELHHSFIQIKPPAQLTQMDASSLILSGCLCKVPPEDRFRTPAFSKYLYLVQTLLSCHWDTFPTLQFLVHCRHRWELAGFCQLRACACKPQGMWGPSPPSSFILPIHTAQPCLTTRREAGNCFPPSEKRFIELENVYQYFSEGGFGSQVSFLS